MILYVPQRGSVIGVLKFRDSIADFSVIVQSFIILRSHLETEYRIKFRIKIPYSGFRVTRVHQYSDLI